MTREEYNHLQKILTEKKDKARRDYYPSNYGEGFEDAINCVKSILSKQFKPHKDEE